MQDLEEAEHKRLVLLEGGHVPAAPNEVIREVLDWLDNYSRNPMLTGVFLFLFGLGFFFDSASLVCLLTPLYVLINVWELKAVEEPELVKRLGEEYVAYRARTPMFIPGLGPRSKPRG